MFPDQSLWVPGHGNKDRVNAARQRNSEAVRDLKTDQEGVRNDDGCKVAITIVGWVGEDEVEVGHQCAHEGDKGGAHCEDWSDQALVDEGIDAAVLDKALE